MDMESNLFVVADGVGGYEGGELASRLAVTSIRAFFRAHLEDRALTWPFAADPARTLIENMVSTSVKLANRSIIAKRVGKLSRMSTTVAMLATNRQEVVIGHIGDSRVYRVREGLIRCLTEDHSLYNDMCRAGVSDLPSLTEFPFSNVITKALGMPPSKIDPDVYKERPRYGDIYLLCTDGLVETLNANEMAHIIQGNSLEGACLKLVESAYAKGGRDNITAVLVEVESL